MQEQTLSRIVAIGGTMCLMFFVAIRTLKPGEHTAPALNLHFSRSVWLNAETSGNHSYLRLNDNRAVFTPVTDKDVETIKRQFEMVALVKVTDHCVDYFPALKNSPYYRGIFLSHEPINKE